jgi:succinoglycan biosynthesis transport protein ExoP
VKVIAVTSSLPGEGKTTTTFSLARTLATSGANVIVVDCDLRQSAINRSCPKCRPWVCWKCSTACARSTRR